MIERRLGAGGMSTVFMAKDTVLERPVAVKLLAEHLADDEDFVYRFRREALSAAQLQHPNIVQVFDSGQDPASERHYIVMEYVDGPSAADMLRERKQLDIDETVQLVRDACHGLDYAHRAGVVHRDVKPGNLLFAEEMGATKLADFGIAKAAEQTRITQVGSVLGTAAYLSPEQARGEEAGPASDIYSLGVCAYQFLTGRLPHEYASLTELALKQQQDPVAPVSDYRPEVPPRARRRRAARARTRSRRPLRERARDGGGDRGRRARRGHGGHAAAGDDRLRRHAGDRRHLRHPGAAAHAIRAPAAHARARRGAAGGGPGPEPPRRARASRRRRAVRPAGAVSAASWLCLPPSRPSWWWRSLCCPRPAATACSRSTPATRSSRSTSCATSSASTRASREHSR